MYETKKSYIHEITKPQRDYIERLIGRLEYFGFPEVAKKVENFMKSHPVSGFEAGVIIDGSQKLISEKRCGKSYEDLLS